MAATAASVVAIALSGACSGGGQPSAPASTPAVTSSPTATGAASPTPISSPPAPADAIGTQTREGAVRVAAYFIQDLYPYVYGTWDLSQWSALSAPDCEFCQRTSAEVQALQASGDRRSGGSITITRQDAWTLDDTNIAVDLDIEQAESTQLAADGRTTPIDGAAYALKFVLAWDGGWKVAAVDVARTA